MKEFKKKMLNNKLIEVLEKLSTQELIAKDALRLKKVIDELEVQLSDKVKREVEIFNKYVVRDENGEVIFAEDKETFSVSDRESLLKELDELNNESFYLSNFINSSSIEDVKLNLVELNAIEFIID